MRKQLLKLTILFVLFLPTTTVNAATWYVSTTGGVTVGSTWATATNNLQTAIAAASAGDQVWVAAGTYYPGASLSMKNGVAIYGGFAGTETILSQRNWVAHATIIDGSGNDGNVIFGNNYLDATAILDGFTITNATNYNTANGGGMYNYYSSPTITNVIFSNNLATDGGGMWNYMYSSPSLINITFSNNSAYNIGGAMWNEDNSSPTLTNVTFSGNYATYIGGAMYNIDSSPTINNCILWGDSSEIFDISSTTTINYSTVQGGWSGAGANNSSADPLFVNTINPVGVDNIWGTADDGLRLQVGSPAINAGNNSLIPIGITTDMTGTVRIQGGTADMGAYETICKISTAINQTICSNQLPYMYLGHNMSTASIDTLHLTNIFGCDSLAILNLTVNASPTITVNSATICAGSTQTLTASGALTYTWNTTANTPNIIITPSNSTSYTVAGSGVNGCTNTAVSSVMVNVLPTVTVNSGVICSGQSFTLVPSGASTYTYSGGSSVVNPTSNTSYSVTGTSAQGCVSSNTAVSSVTVNALPTITVNSGAICSGQSFTMTASGASTYTYSSGSPIVAPASNTSYSVTGTSLQGCVSSNVAVSSVTVNTLPTILVTSSNTLLCVGQSASITANGATSYTWNSGATTSIISVSPAITTTYTVNGIDVNGCSNMTTITQNVNVCTDISQNTNLSSQTLIYPNPSTGYITVITPDNATSLIITDMLGNELVSFRPISTNTLIDLNHQANGVYFIKVYTNGLQSVHRIIINK